MSSAPSSQYDYVIYALKQAFAVPAVILAMSTVGFGGFAYEMGFSLAETLFIIPVIWALPSQVTLMSGYAHQLDIYMIFLTVTFTAIRFLPMTASFLPLLRNENTPKWQLILFSHLVVITTWVEGRRMFETIPRQKRLFIMTIYGITLVIESMIMASLGYMIAGSVSAKIAASLVYIIPLYFCLSLLYSAIRNKELIAFLVGLLSLPFTHMISPHFDLIISGLIGGSVAFILQELSHNKHLKTGE